MNPMIVIKIGGSAITEKDEMEMLKPAALQKAIDCIRQCVESGASIVVVHGAGSFGHHHAKEFEINKGIPSLMDKKEQENKMLGFSLTRQSVQKLNQLVVKAFLDVGVPAVGCSPCSSWRTRQKELVSWPKKTIGHLLDKKLVPVLHGDCCIDETVGCFILSGDTIIKTLCLSFDVRRAVFLTDVAGIYDRPPFEPGAKLLKSIYVRSDGSVEQEIGTRVVVKVVHVVVAVVEVVVVIVVVAEVVVVEVVMAVVLVAIVVVVVTVVVVLVIVAAVVVVAVVVVVVAVGALVVAVAEGVLKVVEVDVILIVVVVVAVAVPLVVLVVAVVVVVLVVMSAVL
ncbi:isopentenyl phosphate kinase [Elysia marginata]|uniref:Isopentenyl phosphate kinase n=1 Tax=Elysia marginata TaxID=1093978 RepID=A0AAV4HZG8_9GAST|nr:isopentenyl phosphate kinase [Elysia marginata]